MTADKVALYTKPADAETFLNDLQAGIRQRQLDYESNKIQPYSPGSAQVEVYRLEGIGAQAFAAERKSHAHPSATALFLSRGAVQACKELRLSFPETDDQKAPNKEIPSQAKLVIKGTFRTAEQYADMIES